MTSHTRMARPSKVFKGVEGDPATSSAAVPTHIVIPSPILTPTRTPRRSSSDCMLPYEEPASAPPLEQLQVHLWTTAGGANATSSTQVRPRQPQRRVPRIGKHFATPTECSDTNYEHFLEVKTAKPHKRSRTIAATMLSPGSVSESQFRTSVYSRGQPHDALALSMFAPHAKLCTGRSIPSVQQVYSPQRASLSSSTSMPSLRQPLPIRAMTAHRQPRGASDASFHAVDEHDATQTYSRPLDEADTSSLVELFQQLDSDTKAATYKRRMERANNSEARLETEYRNDLFRGLERMPFRPGMLAQIGETIAHRSPSTMHHHSVDPTKVDPTAHPSEFHYQSSKQLTQSQLWASITDSITESAARDDVQKSAELPQADVISLPGRLPYTPALAPASAQDMRAADRGTIPDQKRPGTRECRATMPPPPKRVIRYHPHTRRIGDTTLILHRSKRPEQRLA